MTKQQRRRMHRMWNLVNTIFDKHKSIASCYFKRNVIVKREIFSKKMEYWINLELKLDLEKEFIVFVFLFWRILATSAHFSAKENFEWSALKRISALTVVQLIQCSFGSLWHCCSRNFQISFSFSVSLLHVLLRIFVVIMIETIFGWRKGLKLWWSKMHFRNQFLSHYGEHCIHAHWAYIIFFEVE